MEMKDDLTPEIVKSGIIGGPEALTVKGLGRPFLSIGLTSIFDVDRNRKPGPAR